MSAPKCWHGLLPAEQEAQRPENHSVARIKFLGLIMGPSIGGPMQLETNYAPPSVTTWKQFVFPRLLYETLIYSLSSACNKLSLSMFLSIFWLTIP